MKPAEIRELFSKFGAQILQDDVWTVQQATVIKHKALERLAAAAKIEFDAPQILRAERDEAVVLVIGKLGDRAEWSIGEALVNVNYRVAGKMVAYVYAMAEKRAKDRVIIKLAGLHGLYSEDEADEFREASSPAPKAQERPPISIDAAKGLANACTTVAELEPWWRGEYRNFAAVMHPDDLAALTKHVQWLKASLPENDQTETKDAA